MPSDLWNFAKTFYARPSVEAACLRLQEQGADVCVVLCAAWLQQARVACTPARTEALMKIAAPWQDEVVVPLRQLRQRWREAAAHDRALNELREQVKKLELDSERQQLDRMQQRACAWPTGETDGDWLTAIAGQHDRDALKILRVAITHA